MMSATETNIHRNATNPEPHESLPSTRLSLKPKGADRGIFDGAWWPRSTDASTEVPQFLQAMSRLGVKTRGLALNMGPWKLMQRRVSVDGSRARIGWFRTGNPRLARLTDWSDRPLDFFIIPWETDDEHAERTLASIAAGRDPQFQS